MHKRTAKSNSIIRMASNENSANYRVLLPIDPKFFGFIIGEKGATIKRIRNETKATITIPRPNEIGEIEIAGASQENVDAARKQIESLVKSWRYDKRHMINVCIVNETIKNNFNLFMRQILADDLVDGLTETMCMRPVDLHISLNAMALSDEIDLVCAREVLDECLEKVIIPVKNEFGKIEVKISGVRVFGDVNPSKVKVVYGNIESAALQKIADGIKEYLVAKGFSTRDTDMKMRMKWINTYIALEQSEADANRDGISMWRRPTPRKYLDVRPILAKYANYEFGTQEVTKISLSSIDEKGSDGYYTIVASVTF